MNEFKKLRKGVRLRAVKLGIIKLVAGRTGKSPSAVSRTFSGVTDVPDKTVVAELHKAMVELGVDREFTA